MHRYSRECGRGAERKSQADVAACPRSYIVDSTWRSLESRLATCSRISCSLGIGLQIFIRGVLPRLRQESLTPAALLWRRVWRRGANATTRQLALCTSVDSLASIASGPLFGPLPCCTSLGALAAVSLTAYRPKTDRQAIWFGRGGLVPIPSAPAGDTTAASL
jgi:hypothetical protein